MYCESRNFDVVINVITNHLTRILLTNYELEITNYTYLSLDNNDNRVFQLKTPSNY